MALIELAAGTFLIADFVYWRFIADKEGKLVDAADKIDIPQTEEGGPEPYIFGRTLVERPILAWHGTPHAYVAGPGLAEGRTLYSMSMLLVLGSPFADGDSTNRIHALWQGDVKYNDVHGFLAGDGFAAPARLSELDGNGDYEDVNRRLGTVRARLISEDEELAVLTEGEVEFLNGNPNQQLCDPAPPYTPRTRAGLQMTWNTGNTSKHLQGDQALADMVDYRGVLSVFLYSKGTVGADNLHFQYGLQPQLGPIRVEASSYKDNGSYPATGIYARCADEDSNPINVVYDLLVAKRKLGLASSRIDFDAFNAAASVCYQDEIGYSRCFDSRTPARDIIRDVMRHVDGVFYENTTTGKYTIKLIRPDFNPPDLFHITRANCKKIVNFAMSGLAGLPNKVRVKFRNRARGYMVDSVIAQNNAHAVGQDGVEREEVVEFLGCTTVEQARRHAARELAVLSHPVIKMRALMNREALDLNPGDAVKVTMSNPDLSGVIFRVASPFRGTLGDGTVALDLISDYFYNYRGRVPEPPAELDLPKFDNLTLTLG